MPTSAPATTPGPSPRLRTSATARASATYTSMRSTSRTDADVLIDQMADSAIHTPSAPIERRERDPQPAGNGHPIEDQEHGGRYEERERDPAPRLREVRTVTRVGRDDDGGDRRRDDDGPALLLVSTRAPRFSPYSVTKP